MKSSLVPSVGLVVGGILWGIFWIPLRALDEAGISGAWPGLLVYVGVAALLLPLLAIRPGLLRSPVKSLAWCGLFTGTAFALYGISLFYTDVVRVLLLFYITPVWSTLLGAFLLGEKITRSRLTALVLGLSGLLVILGVGTRFPWPQNLGDWMALFSGMAWAYGTLCVYRLKDSGVYEQLLAFTLGGFVVSAIALMLGGAIINTPISLPQISNALPLLAIAVAMMLPMLFLTIWPARLLSPGRVGLLLMSEVVVGVGSAAWLTGEPFGVREVTGTILVIAAGLVEVFGNVRQPLEA